MSDTINKQALLEWLKNELGDASKVGARVTANTLEGVISEIQPGRFDYPSNQGEVQRLRAAVEMIRQEVAEHCTPIFSAHINHIAHEALSTTTDPIVAGVREPVQWYAQQMEQTLRANDHKGGWEGCSLDWLIERLYQESQELWKAIKDAKIAKDSPCLTPGEIKRIIWESTDVANFAMMIADNARRLTEVEE